MKKIITIILTLFLLCSCSQNTKYQAEKDKAINYYKENKLSLMSNVNEILSEVKKGNLVFDNETKHVSYKDAEVFKDNDFILIILSNNVFKLSRNSYMSCGILYVDDKYFETVDAQNRGFYLNNNEKIDTNYYYYLQGLV